MNPATVLKISTLSSAPAARRSIRLLCFPCAGGSATLYNGWHQHMPVGLEVCPVDLPGHGRRYGEPLASDSLKLVSDLYRTLAPARQRPYALFGHSMGGLIAFELTLMAQQEGARLPTCVIISATDPPHVKPTKCLSHLAAPELLREVVEIGGTPAALIADPGFVQAMLPVMRADFRLLENWRSLESQIINVPIIVTFGVDDDRIEGARLEEWSGYTRVPCQFIAFEGKHFYLMQDPKAVCVRIGAILAQMAAREAPEAPPM